MFSVKPLLKNGDEVILSEFSNDTVFSYGKEGAKPLLVRTPAPCRNNSRLFAEISANIFSANGIKVYLFEDMRPTPEMSFAIRHFGCQSGIILLLLIIRRIQWLQGILG